MLRGEGMPHTETQAHEMISKRNWSVESVPNPKILILN